MMHGRGVLALAASCSGQGIPVDPAPPSFMTPAAWKAFGLPQQPRAGL